MPELYFDLDDADRICAVSENWDDVAKAQNAPALTAFDIIGKSVWPYIAGAGTQEFFAAIFAKVRHHSQSVRLPYRCDAPMMKRCFVMDITKQPNGDLRVSHDMVENTAEAFSVLQMPEAAIEAVCSICLSVQRQGQWRDDYFSPRGTVAPEAFTVCENCQNSAQFTWSGQP